MKKALYLLFILILSASCKAMMEPLRVQLAGTAWLYETDDQTARVIFPDDTHVNILQFDINSGNTQTLHGTYYCDGHAVLCNGEDWTNQIKFVRTFSHLKNSSTNKNMTPIYPESHKSVKGSVWAAILHRNLHLAYFMADGKCLEGIYKNVIHEEGVPYGWEWKKQSFTHDGNQIKAGQFKATLYDTFMTVDTLAVRIASPAPESKKTTAITGTVWTYESAPAGAIVFTSDSLFTRILVSSKIVHDVDCGTYKLQGTSLEMTLDDKKETCQIEGGRFTFFDKTYAKVTLP